MRPRPVKKIPADAEQLVSLSLALFASGSRTEDRFWENRLDALLARLLRGGNQSVLDAALDQLQQRHAEAYGALADLAETQSESAVLEHEGSRWEVVLVAAPILAWTRYMIPSGKLKPDAVDALTNQFVAHVAARGTRIALVPYLYSIDQLPRAHTDAYRVMQQLAQASLNGEVPRVSGADMPESAPILADPRFLLAAIAAPADAALFRWQELESEAQRSPYVTRQACQDEWRTQAGPTFANVLAGCEFECLLPDAYHAACRDADERIRPHTIRTAVRYLEDTLQTTANELRAVIGGFGEHHIDEYRIGFGRRGSNDVLYGVVWPLYGREHAEEAALEADDRTGTETTPVEDPMEAIVALLRESGVTEIRRHANRFDPEYCDDCGVPLYADPLGEIVHAEMPEDAEPGQQHFH